MQKAIKTTPSLEQVLGGDVEHYDALFIPGGWVDGWAGGRVGGAVLRLQCHMAAHLVTIGSVCCCTQTPAYFPTPPAGTALCLMARAMS